jgi:hypothetical protein
MTNTWRSAGRAARGREHPIISMMPRSFLRLATVAAMAIALAGCGRTESYRYKLTLAVNTPDGIRRASSVVDVVFFDVSIPARGTMHKLRGEALYLDLGADARPLIALLSRRIHPKYGEEQRWTPETGPGTRQMSQLYGIAPSAHYMDDVPLIARMRGPRKISPADLPDLVTFADISDPNSVIAIDPNDLQATLGPGITWHDITLEATDEPITTGIRTKLPWLPAYFDKNLRLDGTDHGAKNELANRLSWFEFDQSGDLKRSR